MGIVGKWYSRFKTRMGGQAAVTVLGLVGASGAVALSAPIPESIFTFLDRHCIECHDDLESSGDLDFYELDFDLKDKETTRLWTLVHDRIVSGEMPPPEKPRPNKKDADRMLGALAKEITAADRERASVVLRRLNRQEYQNTVRDLFGIDVSIEGLPDDTSTDGFDTVGEGLAVSAEAMQAYLLAAEQVLDAVIGPPDKPNFIRHETNLLDQVDWRGRPQLQQVGKMFRRTDEGLVIFQSGYSPTNLVNFARLRAPAGTYRGSFRVRAIQSDQPVTLRIYGGDTIVNRRERHLVGYWDVPPGEWTTIEFEDRLVEPGGTFQPKLYNTSDIRKGANTYEGPGVEIGDIVIEGPIDEWPPPSRKRLLGDVDPATGTAEQGEAIIRRILPWAFRRPVVEEEVSPYLGILRAGLDEGRSFEEALRLSLKAVLCSPQFLFLDEPGEEAIPGMAFASRLSYFLWSSMPDAELLRLGRSGELNQSEVLRAQVERMLKDPKAKAFTQNFTGQWLDLRDIDFTEPDPQLFPEYDELLRLSIVEETTRFFQEVLDEDLSLLNFIDSDFIFVNERLASHYGIEGVEGQAFRRVSLPAESRRGGVLTQASILKVTANGTNTSPVLRGNWVLENILGTPTSTPPDDVGSVEPDIRGATTLREQLAKHSAMESCASCHDKIDPPGFALESFDPIGGFRERYRTTGEEGDHPGLKRAPFTWAWVKYRLGLPVDSTGHLADGETFTDVREFKELIARDPDQLTRNLTRKLLTYGMGRKVAFADRPAVEEIVGTVREQGYGFRSLVHAVVQHEIFTEP